MVFGVWGLELRIYMRDYCRDPLPHSHLNISNFRAQRSPEKFLEVAVSMHEGRGLSLDPVYFEPFYGEPRNGTPDVGKAPLLVFVFCVVLRGS